MEGRAKYGGYANTAFDPCYHLVCDTVENVSQESLITMAKAAAHALQTLAVADLKNLSN
jgi:aminopeptidase S